MADSTKVEQHRVAERLMGLLGWEHPEALPGQAEPERESTVSYVLRGGGQTAVAAHFVMPGVLEPPSSLAERGLDFCAATRRLVDVTRRKNIPYAFITDLNRGYLYDVGTDELLLHADSHTELDRELSRPLNRADIERGALEEIRRHPRSYAARQLREWVHRWRAQLCADYPTLPEDAAAVIMDRLLAAAFFSKHDGVLRTNGGLRKRLGALVALASSDAPTGCGRGLISLFADLAPSPRAATDLFAPNAALDQVLSKDEAAAPLLREFGMLSRAKFAIATILESFNYGEPAEKARVRMVPDSNEQREAYLAKRTLENVDEARLELDVKEEGYRAIFHWFDALVAVYDRIETDFDTQNTRRPAREDLDLLAWAEQTASRPRALTDKRRHAAERGLLIYYASDRQLRTARLMLLLHLVSRCGQNNDPLASVPRFEATFQSRPRILESDRLWMTEASPHELEDESEVI